MKKRTVRSLHLKKISIASFSNQRAVKGGNNSNDTLCDTCEINCIPDTVVPSCETCFTECANRCGGGGSGADTGRLGRTTCS
ncbi:hypothetical protein [Ascidiimonas aurantiaca]|uniref:hypothetical protein n=1 Tax=Ascidiimonas aurantiaca TaxID=1685432 RepID=UPI0030EE459D